MTEFEQIPNRGHSLTIDDGWREVAEKALAFVKRFVSPNGDANANAGRAAQAYGLPAGQPRP